ncbi:MAG: glycosyltransferase family 2 protein [Nitrospirales bacterium]|nr:glycosyltransferase family 2 protein [Nitrospirales bacterium]
MSSLLSIIVPCYNHERYIRACLESIQAQGIDNYEVIILNDRSTDNTGEVVCSFLSETKDPRFLYYENQENLGATRNFNKGLAMAKGEYIAFIAGDDYWDRSFLLTLMDIVKNEWVDYAFCQTSLVNDDGSELSVTPGDDLLLDDSQAIYFAMLRGNIMGGHSVIFQKDVISRSGPFDTDFPYLSDWEFFLRMTRDFQGVYLKEKLAYYRIHGGNMAFRQFAGDVFQEWARLLDTYIPESANLSLEDVFTTNIINGAVSCLYSYNYGEAKRILDYGKSRLGQRILLNPRILLCWLFALMGSDTMVKAAARIRGKKKGHI